MVARQLDLQRHSGGQPRQVAPGQDGDHRRACARRDLHDLDAGGHELAGADADIADDARDGRAQRALLDRRLSALPASRERRQREARHVARQGEKCRQRAAVVALGRGGLSDLLDAAQPEQRRAGGHASAGLDQQLCDGARYRRRDLLAFDGDDRHTGRVSRHLDDGRGEQHGGQKADQRRVGPAHPATRRRDQAAGCHLRSAALGERLRPERRPGVAQVLLVAIAMVRGEVADQPGHHARVRHTPERPAGAG